MNIILDMDNSELTSVTEDGVIYAPSVMEINLATQNCEQTDFKGVSIALLSTEGKTLAHTIASENKAVLDTNTKEAVAFVDGYSIDTEKMAFLAIGDSVKPLAIIAVAVKHNPLSNISPPAESAPIYPTSTELLKILSQMSETAQRVESADATKISKRAEEKAEVAEQIAKGAQYAKVFSTEAEMKTWATAEMAKAEDQREVKVGDNLYIADTGVPDYWWTGEGDGYSQLETGAVKVEIDKSLSSTSTNPVQNKVIKSALDGKADKYHSHDYASTYNTAVIDDSPDVDSVFGTDFRNSPLGYAAAYNAILNTGIGAAIMDGSPVLRWRNIYGELFTYPLGGGNTEVWKGNVGFGEQDTFFGAKKTADGDGQFQNGYPRLHNHGQDIHEVSGFSRDSRDDETVWSHRLLLPWDLAKANDTSYLMAGVVWNGKRRILNHPDYGLETTFVQPLVPENTGGTKQYGITHAIPCFENSPMYWNGNIIFNDSEMLDSGIPAEATKAVIVPWTRVTGVVGRPDELALKSDIDNVIGEISAILETI